MMIVFTNLNLKKMTKLNLRCVNHITRVSTSSKIPFRGKLRYSNYVDEQAYDETTDVVYTKTSLKSLDPVDNFKGYKVSDFALSNILAAGAVDMLKPCPSLHSTDIDSTLSNIENHFNNISQSEKTE